MLKKILWSAALLLVVSVYAENKLFLAGDSTTSNWYDPRQFPQGTGWGSHLPGFLKPGYAMSNRALGGRTIWRFVWEGSWVGIMRDLKPNDYVFIQFGHNDQRRYSPEFFEVFLKQCIADVREHKAIPVLVTPVPRFYWKNGVMDHTLGVYPDVTRKVAAEMKVDLIDLNKALTEKFNAMGEEKAKAFYQFGKPALKMDGTPIPVNGDREHFCHDGGLFVCRTIIEEAKRTNLPVAAFFNDEMYTRDMTLLMHGDDLIIAWNEANLTDDLTIRVVTSREPFIERLWNRGRKLAETKPASAKATLAKYPKLAKVKTEKGKTLDTFDAVLVIPKNAYSHGKCFYGLSVGKGDWFTYPCIPWSSNLEAFETP